MTTSTARQTHDGLDPKHLDDMPPMAGVVAQQKSRLALFDLPAALALLYFLNSCAQSFPLTATTGFLNEEINMPQQTQSLYYAVTFMPWSLKPLYALIAQLLPIGGYHYKPWLAISSAGSAACYLMMGGTVTTAGGAFGVTLLRAICNAFAELMLDAQLVNHARRDGNGSAATLQAAATSMRYAGTLACALVGLYLYPCGLMQKRLADRTVIALTAVFPGIVSLMSVVLLDEPRDEISISRGCGGCGGGGGGGGRGGGGGGAACGGGGGAACASALSSSSSKGQHTRLALVFCLALPLQAAVLWAQACSPSFCALVPVETWLQVLYGLITTSLVLPVLAWLLYLFYARPLRAPVHPGLCHVTPSSFVTPRQCHVTPSGFVTPVLSMGSPSGLGEGLLDSNSAASHATSHAESSSHASSSHAAPAVEAISAVVSGHSAVVGGHSAVVSGHIASDDATTNLRPSMAPGAAVLLLLALTVTPSASIQVGNFQYALFSGAGLLCETQYLALIGYTSTIGASLALGRAFRKKPLRLVVLVAGLLSTLGGLSDLPLPLLCAHSPAPLMRYPPPMLLPVAPPSPPLTPPPPPPCNMDVAFATAAASAAFGGLISQLGFLPKLVVATEVAAALADAGSAGSGGAAQYYAVMITIIDVGDAISLQLTAPLVEAFGITYTNFSGLPPLMLLTAGCSVLVLLGLALAWFMSSRCYAE